MATLDKRQANQAAASGHLGGSLGRPAKVAAAVASSSPCAAPSARDAAPTSGANGANGPVASATTSNNRKEGGGGGGGSGGGGALLQMHKPLAQLLANRQWWKVCWVYGDQQKYYKQLYGRKKNLTTLRSASGSAPPDREPGSLDTSANHTDDDNDDHGVVPSSYLSPPCFHTSE